MGRADRPGELGGVDAGVGVGAEPLAVGEVAVDLLGADAEGGPAELHGERATALVLDPRALAGAAGVRHVVAVGISAADQRAVAAGGLLNALRVRAAPAGGALVVAGTAVERVVVQADAAIGVRAVVLAGDVAGEGRVRHDGVAAVHVAALERGLAGQVVHVAAVVAAVALAPVGVVGARRHRHVRRRVVAAGVVDDDGGLAARGGEDEGEDREALLGVAEVRHVSLLKIRKFSRATPLGLACEV